MFAYGIAVGPGDKFERISQPSLQRFASGPLLIRRGQASIFPAYNSILDEASGYEGLEGLILLHDDVELLAELEPELRECFLDPAIAIVGAVGGITRRFEWWKGDRRGFVRDARGVEDYGGGRHPVDAVDGLLLALSPWAVRTLRFDADAYSGFHGYDRDLCSQATAHGRTVLVADLPVLHHSAVGDTSSLTFATARRTWQLKWGTSLQRIEVRARWWLRTLKARLHH